MSRKIVGAVVVGLLVGTLIGMLLPAQAGSRKAGDGRLVTLERRVARLEAKARHLNRRGELSPSAVVSTCPSGQPAQWLAIDGTHTYIGC